MALTTVAIAAMPHDALFQPLTDAGLNLQALFDRSQLPPDLWEALAEGDERWSQLLLVGHAGPAIWDQVQPTSTHRDPIDHYSRREVDHFFAQQLAGHRYRLLYPSPRPVPLQRLGELAGWHHPSPLRLGVCESYGSWFAYRALLLTDTQLTPFSTPMGGSACAHCDERPCLSACPAGVLDQLDSVQGCSAFRLAADSPCAEDCPARRACPVAVEQAYSAEQLRYHYRQSLATLRRWMAVPKN